MDGPSDVLHYLDDFALVVPDVGSAQHAKGEMCRLFSSLGLPLEPNKLEGPEDQCGHGELTAPPTSRENGAVGKGTQGSQDKEDKAQVEAAMSHRSTAAHL